MTKANVTYDNSRIMKAKKIISVLSDYRGMSTKPIYNLCLDIGSNKGIITHEISSYCNRVIGIDNSLELIKSSYVNKTENIDFLAGDGLLLPFKDNTFDLVICAQVYEHTTSPGLLLKEIYRILRPGAVCFFSGPNRLWPYEYHYRWYFLHWLPRRLLDIYFRLIYKRNFDLYLLNYWQIMKMCSKFNVIDYTTYVAYELGDFVIEEKMLMNLLTAIIPRSFAKHITFLFPNFNWILLKP